MRWIYSNGRTLTVREVGEVSVKLAATNDIPLPCLDEVLEDKAARALVRKLFDTKFYERVK